MGENQIPSPTFDDMQYNSYLLRLWQEGPGGEQRVMLQDILSGEFSIDSSLDLSLGFRHIAIQNGLVNLL